MEKYGALIETSRRVPGDKRSEECPGHGYPAHTVIDTELKEFRDKDEMLEWVKKQESGYCKKSYRLIRFTELKVLTSINVEFQESEGE